MTYFSYSLLLLLLSTTSLIAVILVILLDVFDTKTMHKIHVLKVALSLLMISPMAVAILTTFSPASTVFERASTSLSMQIEKIASLQEASEGIDYFKALSLLHVMIFSFLLIRLAFTYLSTKKQLKNSKRTLINGQHIWLTKNISAPLCFGIFSKIYAPDNIESTLGKKKI